MDRLQEVMMVKSKADIITGQHGNLASEWETIGHVTFSRRTSRKPWILPPSLLQTTCYKSYTVFFLSRLLQLVVLKTKRHSVLCFLV